jgi:hypothetical protein
MPRRRRERFSSAHVISLIALFVALGGGAYAATIAPKDSVNSNSVVDESLRGRDVQNGKLSGKDLKDQSVTGADVLESSLAQVPSAKNAANAGKLDGKDSTQFINSDEYRRVQVQVVDSTNNSTAVTQTLDAPGAFKIEGSCDYAGAGGTTGKVTITSSAMTGWSVDTNAPGASPKDQTGLAAGASKDLIRRAPTGVPHIVHGDFAANSFPTRINGLVAVEVNYSAGRCDFSYSRFGG